MREVVWNAASRNARPTTAMDESLSSSFATSAQASGRNLVNWDRRLELDAQYVENLSFAMDCKVLIMTVQTVFGRSETVAEDTNAAEGNLAQIRREKMQQKASEQENS